MTTFTYTDSVHTPEALRQSLISHGIFDAVFLIQTDHDDDDQPTGTQTITIETATGVQASCDAAVADAKGTGLIGSKTALIDQVKVHTATLAAAGVTFTRPSDAATGKGPLAVTYETRTNLRNLRQDVAEALIALPQMVDTQDGRGVELFTAADIGAAYQAVVGRGQYLLNNGVNGDGSHGEAALIKQIVQAADHAALAAIVDTRV